MIRKATDTLKAGDFGKPRFAKAYGFALVTGVLFVFSWVGQFVTQMMVVSNEAQQHNQPFEWNDFLAQFFASTFENWQSEFLQLVWQATGLALLLFWGSSQSRGSEERIEAKLDMILARQGIDPDEISRQINEAI